MAHQNSKDEIPAGCFQFKTGSGVNISIESRTSTSLLRKVKAFDDEGWRQLVDTHGDRIYYWSLRSGMPPTDARDVTAEVFVAIVRKIKDFRHEPQEGGFRKWVRVITKNKIRDYWRKRHRMEQVIGGTSWHRNLGALPFEPAEGSDSSSHAVQDGSIPWIDEVRAEVSSRDWAMFQRLLMDQRSASEVAEEFGTTANVVYLVKSRLLKRLRQLAGVDTISNLPAK